jgi:hypothetical protein
METVKAAFNSITDTGSRVSESVQVAQRSFNGKYTHLPGEGSRYAYRLLRRAHVSPNLFSRQHAHAFLVASLVSALREEECTWLQPLSMVNRSTVSWCFMQMPHGKSRLSQMRIFERKSAACRHPIFGTIGPLALWKERSYSYLTSLIEGA